MGKQGEQKRKVSMKEGIDGEIERGNERMNGRRGGGKK